MVRGEFRPGGSSASGATSTSCASSGAARSPRSAGRSSRSTAPRSPGSCRRGRDSSGRAAGPTRSSRRSRSSREPRSRRRSWRPTCCRRASPTTDRWTSTRSAPPARSCGSAPERSAPTTAASRLFFRERLRSLAPPPGGQPIGRRCTSGSENTLRRTAPRSGPNSSQAVDIADEHVVLRALWDLVWAGEVTNDTLAPLRALICERRAARVARRSRDRGRSAASGRRLAPGAGRWSPRCSSRRRRRPRSLTPGRCSSSSATAC